MKVDEFKWLSIGLVICKKIVRNNEVPIFPFYFEKNLDFDLKMNDFNQILQNFYPWSKNRRRNLNYSWNLLIFVFLMFWHIKLKTEIGLSWIWRHHLKSALYSLPLLKTISLSGNIFTKLRMVCSLVIDNYIYVNKRNFQPKFSIINFAKCCIYIFLFAAFLLVSKLTNSN